MKLITSGHADRQVLARFEAERQALAMMEHPNIARILDAGTTSDGIPYFVMELVQGDHITEYCDRNKLTPRERLELFIPVCEAVQHAHQKGVMHRDLKPSNVLVHVYDGKPVAKVIDFGLAKALQHQTRLTDKTMFTEFGQMVGTVQYMSPEQARLDALDIDTRSDIYSLGVMLYELLAGSPPIQRETLNQQALLRVLEIIRDTDPPRPSHRLSSSGEKLQTISDHRRIQPSKLQQMLRGDLDWIVMKSLEKDRTRRYETAKDFAADIRRFLDGEAIEARPPSANYRLRKFVGKHRAQVASAGLLLTALTAGIIGTTMYAIKAERARAETDVARVEAEESAQQFKQILKLFTESFESVNPLVSAETTVSAKEVLLRVHEKINESKLDEKTKAYLLNEISRCFLGLGENGWALNAAEDALSIKTEAISLNSAGLALVNLGKYDEGINRFEAALGEPLSNNQRLAIKTNLAIAHLDRGRVRVAIALFEEAIRESKREVENSHLLAAKEGLANALRENGEFEKAVSLQEEIAEDQRKLYGTKDFKFAEAMNDLALSHVAAGDTEKSLALLEESAQIMEEALGPSHPRTLVVINNFAVELGKTGRTEESLKLLMEVYVARKEKLGADHPDTLSSLSNLGSAYAGLGRYAELVDMFEGAHETLKAKYGEDHPVALLMSSNLAHAYSLDGRIEDAVVLSERVLNLQRKHAGLSHPDTLKAMRDLASDYHASRRFDEAVRLGEQALEAHKERFGDDHPDTVTAENTLAVAYAGAGRWKDAIPLFGKVLSIREQTLGKDHSDTLFVQTNYGKALMNDGQHNMARPILESAFVRTKSKQGEAHPDTLKAMGGYACLLWEMGRNEEAIEHFERRVELTRTTFRADHPDVFWAMVDLGRAFGIAGQHEKALPLFEEALESLRKTLGEDDSGVVELAEWVEQAKAKIAESQ